MTAPNRLIKRKRTMRVAATALASVVAAILLYYGATALMSGPGQQPVAVAPSPPGAATSPDSFAFSFFDQPRAMPDLRFNDGSGRALTLEDLRSKPLLLNIWATWCVPCREEMPSFNRLQAKLGKSQLLVLPLSIDRQGLPVVKKFYDELGLTVLGTYLDQSGTAASKLNAVGVPTTLLIDREGREIGRKVGPAEWDSPEVLALLREHLRLSTETRQASP